MAAGRRRRQAAARAAAESAPADLLALLAGLAALVAAHAALATSPAALAVLRCLQAFLAIGERYSLAPGWWSLDVHAIAPEPDTLQLATVHATLAPPAGSRRLAHPDTVPTALRELQATTRARHLRYALELGETPDRLKGTFTSEELRAAGYREGLP